MARPTAQSAMAKAEEAHNEIKTHEAVCAERYAGIGRAVEALARKQDQAIVWLVSTLIAALGAAIGMIFILMKH